MEVAIDELIRSAAMGVELPSGFAHPQRPTKDGADNGYPKTNSLQTDNGPSGSAEPLNSGTPSSDKEWFADLGRSSNLKELGFKLAWGWRQGYLQPLLEGAGPSQPSPYSKGDGLFPLPLWSPAPLAWSNCHGPPTQSLEGATECWLLVCAAALNWYCGHRGHRKPMSRKKIHAAVRSDLMSKIRRLFTPDDNYGWEFEQVVKELNERRISYTGEEVSQPLPLTIEQIIGGLPPVGHGGSIDVMKFLRGRTKYLLEHPLENMVPIDERPEAPIQAKVHIKKGEELKVFELLHDRGIIEWIPESHTFSDQRGVYLNGLFGVVKPKRFTQSGAPVLRVIMNLVPSNALFADLRGDIGALPNATAWMSLTIAQGEQLFLSQGDMQSAFYLFKMPSCWRPYFCFNYRIQGAAIGQSGDSWFRPSCAVLPMGWCASVGIMQMIAREVLLTHKLPYQLEIKKTSALPPWFTKVSAEQSPTAWWQVYLDNFLAGERTCLESAGIAVALQDDAMAAWESERILTAKGKNVVGSSNVVELGVRIDGKLGLLGASTERLFKTALASFHLVRSPWWNKRLAQVVLGRWVFILQFRRAGMAVLSRSWEAVEALPPTKPQIARLNTEVMALVCLIPILQCDLTATYDGEVTCSDASERGGACAIATALTKSGEQYSNLLASPPLQPLELPIVVVSVFNGIGGAFRLYDVLGVKVMGKISIDICREANRTTRTTWGDVRELHDIMDVDEQEVRRWASDFPRAREVHVYAGFPCIHLSSVRAYRQNLAGEGSNLFWQLLVLLEIITRVFSHHCTIKFCIENVASMDDAARKEISQQLDITPIKFDPSDTLPFDRPRLAWTSCEVKASEQLELWQEKEYVRAYVTDGFITDKQWVTPGWTRRDPESCLPTFMKSIRRQQPPPVPAGLRRADEATVNRWVEHEYRFPPYQYAERFLFDHPQLPPRPADASERELLLGYGSGHTESARTASDIKRSKVDFEDARLSLCGDSFAVSSFAIVAAAMCADMVPPMSPGHIIRRMGLAPGTSAHPSLEVPLQRGLVYGAPSGPPADRLQLLKQLGLTVNHTGADVRLLTGEAMGRKVATHASVRAWWWQWKHLFKVRWFQRVVLAGRTAQQRRASRQGISLRDLSITEKTRFRYLSALGRLLPFLEQHPDPQTYDSVICEWIEYQWARGEALTHIVDSLSGLQFYWPALKGCLRLSWRMFRNWRRIEAPARAPPITPSIVAAMVVLAVERNQLAFAVLIAVGFHALLRTGEFLSLQFQDIEFTEHCGVISLKSSKFGLRTGAEEAVAVRDSLTLQLLQTLVTIRKPSAGDKLWPHSGQFFRTTYAN
eukprot:Skav213874  [mRNA]  locus=scaffold2374:77699:81990:+ [translate_table: standard]